MLPVTVYMFGEWLQFKVFTWSHSKCWFHIWSTDFILEVSSQFCASAMHTWSEEFPPEVLNQDFKHLEVQSLATHTNVNATTILECIFTIRSLYMFTWPTVLTKSIRSALLTPGATRVMRASGAFNIAFATRMSRIWCAHHLYNICMGCARDAAP
jgi:hypothetical protein